MKSAQVDVAVGDEQELGAATAALRRGCGTRSPSPRAGSARARPPRPASDSRSRRTTTAARTAGITSGNSGDSSSCSRSPMKKSSWRGLPTTVAGIDRVAPMRQPLDVEDRVVVLQRVVAVVIAERPFRPAHVRRARARSARTRRWRRADAGRGPATSGSRCAGDQRREHQLGHVLGQRRDRRQDQRRRAAEEHGDRQRLRRAPRRPRSGSRRPCRSASACPVRARDRGPAAGTCRGCGPARSGCSV